MELRRLLLRLLLVALALTALAGAIGVVVAADQTLWRIVWTGLVTAAAVAIMLPFSSMIDKPKTAREGMAGLIWAVIGYLFALALIWAQTVLGYSWGEAFGLTLLGWLLYGLPAVLFIRMLATPQTRIAAKSGIALAAAAFVLMMVSNWHEMLGLRYSSYIWPGKWWASSAWLGTMGLLAVINLVGAGTNDKRWWRWLGVAAAAGAWVLAEIGIIQETHSFLGEQMVTALVSIACLSALANVTLMLTLEGGQKWVRHITLISSACCALAVNVMTYVRTAPWDADLWARLAAGSGIIAGCGALALVVLARINRRSDFRPEDAAIMATEIALTCPRCNKPQKIKIGQDACKTCNLRIEVTIEEPRCPKCGYLLYLLQSPLCPECGTNITNPAPV